MQGQQPDAGHKANKRVEEGRMWATHGGNRRKSDSICRRFASEDDRATGLGRKGNEVFNHKRKPNDQVEQGASIGDRISG